MFIQSKSPSEGYWPGLWMVGVVSEKTLTPESWINEGGEHINYSKGLQKDLG